MKTSLTWMALLLICFAFFPLIAWAGPVIVKGNPPTSFTVDRPAYLFFSEAVVERTGASTVDVEMTLCGDVPKGVRDIAVYYLTFDIDDNPETGTKFEGNPPFGWDIFVTIRKPFNSTHIEDTSSEVSWRGRTYDLKVTGLKVEGNKISYHLRSQLFSAFDVSKFYFYSWMQESERGKLGDSAFVDRLPAHGYSTLGSSKKGTGLL